VHRGPSAARRPIQRQLLDTATAAAAAAAGADDLDDNGAAVLTKPYVITQSNRRRQSTPSSRSLPATSDCVSGRKEATELTRLHRENLNKG